MPWFKVDDNLAFHHKVVAAGNPAMGLWVRCGSLCSQQLTDGFIPDHMLPALGTKAQAEKLVTVGLWDRVDKGYRFHGWSERQPSKVDVEAERAAAKDRMRAARARKKQGAQEATTQVSDSRSEDVRANTGRSSGEVRETFGNPDPTRPDPSRPDPREEPSAAPAATQKPKRATTRPTDFQPTQAHIDLAAERGVDLRLEWDKFCDWCSANGKTYKDWPAALRNWIRNARPTLGLGAGQSSNMTNHLTLVEQLAAEEAATLPRQIGDGS